jgi:XTP/dITP diphosphohydrolase
MVYMRHAGDPTPLICQGTWEGRILTRAPRRQTASATTRCSTCRTGDCSAAELDAATKNALSHRGQALRSLVQQLSNDWATTGNGTSLPDRAH